MKAKKRKREWNVFKSLKEINIITVDEIQINDYDWMDEFFPLFALWLFYASDNHTHKDLLGVKCQAAQENDFPINSQYSQNSWKDNNHLYWILSV